MKHDIIVIGGGASGIIAAIIAKDSGKDVAILEGNDRIGKKILTTGNGRCNISNKCLDHFRYHSENEGFPDFILGEFNYSNTEALFNSFGLPLITLDGGKMYPMSLQASSVLDILRTALLERSIPIYLNSKVKKVDKKKNSFIITTTSEEVFQCSKAIISTGGVSAPKSGSDGSGYSIAKTLGHKLIPCFPALVQLKLDYKGLKALSGIKFDGFGEIFVNNKAIRKEFGEILFTDYGISGPPILQLSRIAATNTSQSVSLVVDMMPNFSKASLKDFLENHWGTFSYRSVHDSLIGIINKKLIPILLKEANISSMHKPCFELTWLEIENIIKLLKQWTFKVCGTNSFSNSQVTAGGIATTEVDNRTLQSKLVSNLYFCGEILDVDGDCGGFNLQWAWASGYTAGINAATN